MENIRETIGKNLADLRKKKGLTQYELAEKFNYSDRAISKWENGDTLPDIETLAALAEFYGVSLDYLTHSNNQEQYVKKMDRAVLVNRITIALLLSSIIWIIATIYFVYTLLETSIDTYWMAFVWAVPLNCLVLVFTNMKFFKSRLMYFIVLSVFFWSVLACVYLQLLIDQVGNFWPVFFIGVPLEVTLLLACNITNIKIKPEKQ